MKKQMKAVAMSALMLGLTLGTAGFATVEPIHAETVSSVTAVSYTVNSSGGALGK